MCLLLLPIITRVIVLQSLRDWSPYISPSSKFIILSYYYRRSTFKLTSPLRDLVVINPRPSINNFSNNHILFQCVSLISHTCPHVNEFPYFLINSSLHNRYEYVFVLVVLLHSPFLNHILAMNIFLSFVNQYFNISMNSYFAIFLQLPSFGCFTLQR